MFVVVVVAAAGRGGGEGGGGGGAGGGVVPMVAMLAKLRINHSWLQSYHDSSCCNH